MSDMPNDPTRAGGPVLGAAVLSLPEVEALCLKAARGAGMSWGMAEEAGRSAAWLVACGLPGPEMLLSHLADEAAGMWAGRAPVIGTDEWRAADGGALCPIRAGAAFADIAGPLPLTIERLARPALLLPALALVAGVLGRPVRLTWDGHSVAVDIAAIQGGEGARRLCTVDRADVRLELTGTVAGTAERRAGHPISRETWQALDRFALMTTVPATEQSRADAGASGSDND